MRIGLNLLHSMPEIGGGWNYIANLIQALGNCDKQNTYVAFLTQASRELVPTQPNFQHVLINIRSDFRPLRILYENTLLQLQARRYELDCMHWFSGTHGLWNTIPSVVTVYDLLAFENRKTNSPPWKKLYLRGMIRRAAKSASLLLPMSETTADELQSVLDVEQQRMVTVPPIIQSEYYPRSQHEIRTLRAQYHLPERFWLYVAHFYEHKNHSFLLHSYHQLKKHGHQPWPLVLRGDPKGTELRVEALIDELGLQDDVVMVQRLTEAELATLYSAASALIFPSSYEGAGIPLIEAMACGCPVAVSDISAAHEFCQDAAVYFSPNDSTSIGATMRELQKDASLRQKLQRSGLQHADSYRASSVASKLINAYEVACSR